MKSINKPMMYRLLSIVILITVFLSGCSSKVSTTQDNLATAALDAMPAEIKAAPVSVQQAYQFAVANPDILKQIPCNCGCGSMGHTSNYACYISEVDSGGTASYDTHALGCSICVDITHDTMPLLKEGKTTPEIKLYVDQTYSQYGPSNIP